MKSKSAMKRENIQSGQDMDYPAWICHDCGVEHGNRKTTGTVASWHVGVCGVCSCHTAVTEPRDFGHLKDSWRSGNG